MTYTPKSGGGPAKLVAYLRSKEPGYRVSTATASAIMCLPIASVKNTLAPAISGGLLVHEVVNGKGLFWLADGVPPVTVAQQMIADGLLETDPPAEDAAGEVPADEFHAMLHIDGDLDLHGMQPLANGGFRIEAADVGRLFRLLGGC